MIYKAGTPQHFTPITVHDSAWFKDTLRETHILDYLMARNLLHIRITSS